MTTSNWWRYLRGLAPAVMLFAIVLGIIIYAVENRLRDEHEFEENILKEWVLETRVGQATLGQLVEQYLAEPATNQEQRRDAVLTHLSVLGEVTRTNQGLLPLFPFVYRMELHFTPEVRPDLVWSSNSPIPRDIKPQAFTLVDRLDLKAVLLVYVQLRAFASRQEEVTQRQAQMQHGLSLIAIAAAAVALLWVWLFLHRERSLELSEYRSKEEVDKLERQRLTEQLLREEEELKRKEAEKQALESRTKLYADISVLAGSYAHNIKNLLVRPNDLLERCLTQSQSLEMDKQMIGEARDSLRVISERTQQILRTVRRDMEEPENKQLNLNELAQAFYQQWHHLALQQWKLELLIRLHDHPVFILGDASHLQQALENLLCNARDATFDERNKRREQARSQVYTNAQQRREGLLAAASWMGRVTLSVLRSENQALLILADNGSGMSEETLKRCTDAHYTTKRDNALHEGLASGMGLGLNFVIRVIEQHQGRMEINSQPRQGTTIRLNFPAVKATVEPDLHSYANE